MKIKQQAALVKQTRRHEIQFSSSTFKAQSSGEVKVQQSKITSFTKHGNLLLKVTCNFHTWHVKHLNKHIQNSNSDWKVIEAIKTTGAFLRLESLNTSDLLKWQFYTHFAQVQFTLCIMESNSQAIRNECASMKAISLFTILRWEN